MNFYTDTYIPFEPYEFGDEDEYDCLYLAPKYHYDDRVKFTSYGKQIEGKILSVHLLSGTHRYNIYAIETNDSKIYHVAELNIDFAIANQSIQPKEWEE